MKVVISGGSGLIGRAICQALLAAGHEPVVLTRDLGRASRLPAGVRAVAWNPPGQGDWAAELASAGAVINLAGESIGRWPWTAGRKKALWESRVAATRAQIVDALPLVADAVPLGTTTATVSVEPARLRVAAPLPGAIS